MRIPFNKPFAVGTEYGYMRDAVERMHISGDGPYTKKCQTLLEELLGVKKVLLTTSCTHALEMAALLLDIEPGDEVIVPSFTFVSTANAFALRGAKIVFADVRSDTLNLDESQLERLITPRTKAVVPVHYAGVGCEMAEIMRIAERSGIAVVEDDAHGLFGRYRGRNLGTFGATASLSFHETKSCHCGEGGALLINDPSLIERAEIIRDKGTDRSRFFRGEVDKYTWIDLGSSYVLSDLLAAFLYAQLEARERIQSERRRVWRYYREHLAGWAADNNVRLPAVPGHCEQAYHMFYVIMPSLDARNGLIAHLGERGFSAVFHYQPLHLSRMGASFGSQPGDCPVTEGVSDRLLRLPFFVELEEDIQARAVGEVKAFRCGSL